MKNCLKTNSSRRGLPESVSVVSCHSLSYWLEANQGHEHHVIFVPAKGNLSLVGCPTPDEPKSQDFQSSILRLSWLGRHATSISQFRRAWLTVYCSRNTGLRPVSVGVCSALLDQWWILMLTPLSRSRLRVVVRTLSFARCPFSYNQIDILF